LGKIYGIKGAHVGNLLGEFGEQISKHDKLSLGTRWEHEGTIWNIHLRTPNSKISHSLLPHPSRRKKKN
jgi:hypothetical protein